MIANWISEIFHDSIPEPGARLPVPWMERHVRLIGSARKEGFDFSVTPWTKEPVERATSGACRTVTFIKPVQSGGSAAGEAALCFWISNENGGFQIHYNWENDQKAGNKWDERIEAILKACGPLMMRAPNMEKIAGKWKRCHVHFPHCHLKVQGVWQPEHLDSDAVRFVINEEIHGWEPGRLAKAYNRTTAVWNAVIFNISNASKQGDQLHAKYLEGTQQQWEVLCPCGKNHVMRAKWEDDKPHLGGLRYDSDKFRMEDDGYDYNRLERTIRYQMPCGREIADDPVIRRQMSQGGRYSEPRNKGAKLTNRSYTLEAVAVDYIPWLTLIQEKHAAIKSMRFGDPEPWWKYLTERECYFINPDYDRPVLGVVKVNEKVKKSREGLKNRVSRFGALDFQAGQYRKRETSHYWGVIRDFDINGNSLLVDERKLESDAEAAAWLLANDVKPWCVVVDSGHNASHIYDMCLKHGWNPIKGDKSPWFAHTDKKTGVTVKRLWKKPEPLHAKLNIPRTRENPDHEPHFWLYSRTGLQERLHWLRGADGITFEIPGDVSDDYRAHMESWELREKIGRDGRKVLEFHQVQERDDLKKCEEYCVLEAMIAGLIGGATPEREEKK